MEFEQIIEDYLKDHPYEAELTNFKKCLNLSKRPLDIPTLKGIGTNEIKECLNTLIKNGTYKKKSIARKFSVAIYNFLKVSVSKGYFNNADITSPNNLTNTNDESYYFQMNKYIDNTKDLKELKSNSALEQEDIDILVDYCDSYLSTISINNFNIEEICSCLIIKLMIFTGIKYQVNRNILLEDLKSNGQAISINGIIIRLPINLSLQFQKYLDIRLQKSCEFKSQFLFITNDDNQWYEKVSNSNINKILTKLIGNCNSTGLTKYGINNLILVGMNISNIKKLTKAGPTILNDCIPVEDNTLIRDKEINSQLVKLNSYYTL